MIASSRRNWQWHGLWPILLCLVLLLVVWAAWTGYWRHRLEPFEADPRLNFATPFANLRPEVQYVGDEACARCHPEHAKTYRQHPMGRSLATVDQATALERYAKEQNNPFSRSGLDFLVDWQGPHVFHKEICRDGRGTARVEFEAEVAFAIGSGARARSYLINREGYLFESAITWYSQKGVWDLSPGFEANPHSDRMVTAECLFCHANQVAPVQHTINRYRLPIFRGYAIGCERCHGPGELHVKRREQGELVSDVDHSIVNPAHLEPALREAVCQQCHLQGEERILRRGRQFFDFRPGLPWHLFWSVFVRPPEQSDSYKAVGQVEQVQSSRCFTASKGELGCTSCHDPHSLPDPAAKVAYYRSRCLSCHKETSCRLSRTARQAKDPNDDCVRCHMPRIPSTDVAHTALTDHRILRQPNKANALLPPASRPVLAGTDLPLVRFPSGPLEPREDESRELGLALLRVAEVRLEDRAARQRLARTGLPLLEAATRKWPQDLPAWQAQGYAFWLLDREPEAMAALEAVLAMAPDREQCLVYAATLAAQVGRLEPAVNYWQRALAVNPWSARSYYELAKVFVLRQQWPEAAGEGETAVRLHPFHLEARKLLVACYLQMGDRQRARAALEVLMALNPAAAESVRRLYPLP